MLRIKAIKQSALTIGTGILLLFVSCDGEKSTHPAPTLEGAWDIAGYADHGVSGATTGSCIFRDDGTYAILGTVTYPGEPVDSLDVSGTYQVVATLLTMTTPDGGVSWSLAFSGDRVVLTLIGVEPPTTMTLKRQS